MKPHRVNLVGKIDNNGNLLIANMSEMREFAKKWKGQSVTMVAEVNPESSSKALQGYYFNKVVPDYQKIYKDMGDFMTLQEVDIRMRHSCPIMMEEVPKEEAGGFELERVRTVYEISSSEMVDYIEHLRIIAAQDYNYEIEDPKRF